jgi:transposase
MPTPRVLMSKIRRTLQLLADSGLSTRQVAAALNISKSTVSEIALYARTAGIDWVQANTLSDEELQARLYPPPRPRSCHRQEPDYAELHQELKRPGVTLLLLWEEYRACCGEQAYRYSAFCEKYRAFARGLKRSMRQMHLAGERLFVDYAGQTVAIVDALTGEIRRAQVFVAVLGASNYTYACATLQQTAVDWVGSIIAALNFFGGVPRLLVPDQPRALIANPDAYEPMTARPLQELAEHYDVAELPARPGRPQDKGRVERSIRYIREAFFAAREFTDLHDQNAQARVWCEGEASDRRWPEDSRLSVREAFEAERASLLALPEREFALGERLAVDVGKAPYVRFDLNDYTVPHTHVRRTLAVLADDRRVRVFDGIQEVASHVRSYDSGQQLEDPAHIQALVEHKRAARAHRGTDRLAHAAPAASALLQAAAARGHNLGAITAALLRLLERYGASALQAATGEALQRDVPHPNAVRLSLERAREEQGLPPPTASCLSAEVARRDALVRSDELASYDRIAQAARSEENDREEDINE